MAITRIVNPRVYTKDSFYYQFVWEWEVVNDQGEIIVGANPDIDLNKEYEVMLYNNYNIPYNENKNFIVKYNEPISFLDIYNLYKEDGLLQRGANVKFKIREKQENDLNDWSDLFPSDSSFLLAPSVINCSTITNNAKNQMLVTVGPEFRNYYNNNIDNYNLTILKQNADKLSVYASDNNEGLIYEPQANHTAHLEWSANDHGDEWIRFDLDQITNIAKFSGINLSGSTIPISCEAQISNGEVVDDSRSIDVNTGEASSYIKVNDFTTITIDSFGEYGWENPSLHIIADGNYFEASVGDVINVSSYNQIRFIVGYESGLQTTVQYTVNEEQWTTIETYSDDNTVVLKDIKCSSIRLRGAYIGNIDNDISIIISDTIPNQDSYKQENPLSLFFNFALNYNSDLSLETEYNTYVSEEKISSWGRDNEVTIIIPQEEHTVNSIDFTTQIEIPTPSYQGGLVYIKQGYGWKISGVSVSPGETIDCLHGSLKKETIIIDKNEEAGIFSPLSIIIYGAPNAQTIAFKNKINFLTGTKYAQQIEAFDDLKTIKPISDISNNEFTYQYDSINEHTPVFIYQKMIDNTYNLTNNLSNLNTGTLNTDFENTSKNDLIVTTSPVINYKYGAVSLNGNTYTHINVQDYKNFIISTIKIGSGIPSDHTSGYIQIAYDDDFSFENAQIVNNNDVINVENYNYVNIKFVRDIGSGSSIIKYFLEEEGEQSLKTVNITTEEIGEYTEEHAYMLNVNKVFNSLEESIKWDEFKITSEKGQPKLTIQATKENFSNLYSYKILIQNQMTTRQFVNKELDLKYFATNACWCIYENNIEYFNGYILSNLVHNELSSKEKYHIIIKRTYNGDEYIIEKRNVAYEDNTDFFLAPSDNINYNPGEKDNFYFSTKRNYSESAAQGYPWLIYNNEDNVSYFCYSNQAYNSNADNRGVDNYDSNKSDNKQLIHINYHDKPNFTPKEVIPMLDFKITELIKQQNPYQINASNIGNQNNVKITSYSNSVTVSSNGDNASFTIKPLIENGYISFAGNSDTVAGTGRIEVLDKETGISLYASNDFSSGEGSYFLKDKKVNNDTTLLFKLPFSNSSVTFTNCTTKTLVQPNNSNALLQKRKFYIDNFSINEIDYSQIENGSIISGQVLELHKPITLHIEDFTTNMSSYNSIYYKIEKVNEYNQDVITPIDDDNSITILQKDDNDNVFTKDFYINSHTNQLKIQNTKTKQITFNNAQKDTIVNCILEKEEVED